MSNKDSAKILVIDPDPLLSELVHFHFSKEYEIDRISSLEDFLNTDVEDYSLVIIDVFANNHAPREIVDMLRGNYERKIPVLMTAPQSEHAEVVTCLSAGASDFISRPFDVKKLTGRIRNLLGK